MSGFLDAGHADAGRPQLLSGVELDAEPLTLVGPVFSCENREVYDAAVFDLGAAAPQLICIDGWPSVTVQRLLGSLAPGQARHHGDFDWGGWRIARFLASRFGVGPWRYSAEELIAARARHPDAGIPLTGSPPSVIDRDRLAWALLEDGRSVSEELELRLLLDDLRAAARANDETRSQAEGRRNDGQQVLGS